MTDILTTISIGALSLGLVVGFVQWLKIERGVHFAAPRVAVGGRAYRVLERTRQQLFRDSDAVRLTLFLPDPSNRELLRPAARIGWGRPSAESRVAVGKGQGLAGQAWESESILVVRLREFQDREDFDRFSTETLKLPVSLVRDLSNDQMKTRGMIAMCLSHPGHFFRGILCIDTTDETLIPEPTSDIAFFAALVRLGQELAMALPEPRKVSVRPEARTRDRLGEVLDVRLDVSSAA